MDDLILSVWSMATAALWFTPFWWLGLLSAMTIFAAVFCELDFGLLNKKTLTASKFGDNER